MDGLRDDYLSRTLKNWASQPRPPANGRLRLLCRAALQVRYKQPAWLPVFVQPELRPVKWSSSYTFWHLMHFYDCGLSNSRLIM